MWKQLAFLFVLFCSFGAHAVDLKYAIGRLNNNPALLAAREEYSRVALSKYYALSGIAPTVAMNMIKSAQGSSSWNSTYSNVVEFRLSQPLFSFGSTVAAYKGADEGISSALHKLRSVEQGLVLSAVRVYLEVIKSRKILEINRKNVENLREFLIQTEARFKKGEVTKTDVALARSRLAGAMSDMTEVGNSLSNAEAEYAAIIGERPDYSMSAPSGNIPGVPSTMEAVVDKSLANNNTLQQYLHRYKAKQQEIKVATARLLPSILAFAQYTRSPIVLPVVFPGGGISLSDGASMSLVLNIPIMQDGGADYIRLRSVEYETKEAYFNYQEARRLINKDAVEAWGALVSSGSRIHSDESAMEAATTALNGVLHESAAGFRTSFDVLMAEQQVRETSVQVERSRFSYIMALFSVLHVMGCLTAEELLLSM